MADGLTNIAASVKQRLLNKARQEGRAFDVLLVRFALERLLYRLSLSQYRDRYVLKGGMLVTLWLEGGARETRDADFLGFGEADEETLKQIFAEIMAVPAEDGLIFDTDALTATAIREDMEYGGIRLRTSAHLERTRIPVVLDIGFGDALADAAHRIDYPSLLDMDQPSIRAYPPASVIAEKFQAIVALGLANGRMKDFHDLWAIPKMVPIDADALDAAIAATFARRSTEVPANRPLGLSEDMAADPAARRRWLAYSASLELTGVDFGEVLDDAWTLLGPSCERLNNRA